MTCDQAKVLIGPYHDGELTDFLRIQELEDHLAECAGCARAMEALRVMSSELREKAAHFEAPAGLEARIKAKTGAKTMEDYLTPTFRSLRWLSPPVLVSAFCIVLLAVGFFLLTSRATARFESEIVSGHYRSLEAAHLFDVPSSDQHIVKPWFQGKLDFSPNVPDLTQAGFLLMGGRLDYMNQRPAAAIVYGRAKHVINVFVMHKTSFSPDGVDSRDGYHLIKWTSGDLDYWAVSDVNPNDLEDFARAFQAATGLQR